MIDKQKITARSPKTEYWKDKNWNDTNGLLWFVQVRYSIFKDTKYSIMRDYFQMSRPIAIFFCM